MVAAPTITVIQKNNSVVVQQPPAIPLDRVQMNTHQTLLPRIPGYDTVTFRNLTRKSEKTYHLAGSTTLQNAVFARGDEVELEFAGAAGKRIFDFKARWNAHHYGSHTHAYFTLSELGAKQRVEVPRQVPEVPKGAVEISCGQTMVRRLQLRGFDTVVFRNETRGTVREYDLARTSVLHGATLSRGDKVVLEFHGENGKRILNIDAQWSPRRYGAHTHAYFTLDELPHSERVEPVIGPPPKTEPVVPGGIGMAPITPWFEKLPKAG